MSFFAKFMGVGLNLMQHDPADTALYNIFQALQNLKSWEIESIQANYYAGKFMPQKSKFLFVSPLFFISYKIFICCF